MDKIISQKDLDLSRSWGHAPSWPSLEFPFLPQYTTWSKCNINCIFQKQVQCLLTLSRSNEMLYRVPKKVFQEKKIFFFTFLPLHSKMTWTRQRNGCKITHPEFRRLNTVTKVLKDKDKVSMLGKLYLVTFEGKVSKCVLILLKSSLFCLVLWFQMNAKIWLNIILYSNGNRILVCLFASPLFLSLSVPILKMDLLNRTHLGAFILIHVIWLKVSELNNVMKYIGLNF